MAAHLGISHKVLFTGFLHGDDVQKIYQMADLYVMPSVSEPFGIAPLEAAGGCRIPGHQGFRTLTINLIAWYPDRRPVEKIRR